MPDPICTCDFFFQFAIEKCPSTGLTEYFTIFEASNLSINNSIQFRNGDPPILKLLDCEIFGWANVSQGKRSKKVNAVLRNDSADVCNRSNIEHTLQRFK